MKKLLCFLLTVSFVFTSCENTPQHTLGTYEGTIDPMETKSMAARGGRSLPFAKRLSFSLALGTKNLIVQYRLTRGKNNSVRGSLWFGNKTSRSFEKGFDLAGTQKSTGSASTIQLSANVRGRIIKDTLTMQDNGKVVVDSAGNKVQKKIIKFFKPSFVALNILFFS